MIFKWQKFSLMFLLSFCLILSQFQSCVAYKSVAYKKACICSIIREMLEMLGNSMKDISKGISKRKIFIKNEELRITGLLLATYCVWYPHVVPF